MADAEIDRLLLEMNWKSGDTYGALMTFKKVLSYTLKWRKYQRKNRQTDSFYMQALSDKRFVQRDDESSDEFLDVKLKL